MRWLFAGVAFALAVGLAIGTAAIRAENTRCRLAIEQTYRQIHDRVIELRSLSLRALEDAAPERLAAAHWAHLRAASQRFEVAQ